MKTTTVDKLWFETLMEQKGVSLRAVARKMAIDASALSRALNSKRKLKPEEIQQLADILEQPTATVLEHVNTGASTPGRPKGFEEMQQATVGAENASPPQKRHPLFGSMKGTSIIMPGVDLTQPADPDWAKVYDDDYDHGVIVGAAGHPAPVTTTLLLDTCAAIWMGEDAPLAPAAVAAMDASETRGIAVLISPISAWERAMLVAKGRLRSPLPPKTWFDRILTVGGLKLAPLSPEILADASFLPEPLHRDPADRIIIATARAFDLTIVTRDRLILDYAALGHVRALAC